MGFLTVVCFGDFRGDADGGAGACLGSEEVALEASLPRAERRRPRAGGGDRIVTVAGLAQTPGPPLGSTASSGNGTNSGSDLLQPTLEGNPATPPRFRRPGAAVPLAGDQPPPPDKFAPTRIGATPIYGSPNGFGAGDTGYDSLNTPRSRKKKKTPQTPAPGALVPQAPQTTFTPVPTFNPAAPNIPPAQTKPPAPDIYPKRAALRPGATLPPPPDELPVTNPPAEVHPLAAANRPGSTPPIPPLEYYNYSVSSPTLPQPNTFALGALPQRLLPILAEKDPYAALGIRAGSFLLFPTLDLSAGYSTNPERATGEPAVRLWCRHAGAASRVRLEQPFAHRRHRRRLYPIRQRRTGPVAQRPLSQCQS